MNKRMSSNGYQMTLANISDQITLISGVAGPSAFAPAPPHRSGVQTKGSKHGGDRGSDRGAGGLPCVVLSGWSGNGPFSLTGAVSAFSG